MPSPFFLYESPTTNEQILRVAAQEKQARETLLYSLPETGGKFAIEFPDGYTYTSTTSNIRARVKKLLQDLLPSPRSKKINQGKYFDNKPKWMVAALKNNKITKISDLKIYILNE